jgi:hypothetical protein
MHARVVLRSRFCLQEILFSHIHALEVIPDFYYMGKGA